MAKFEISHQAAALYKKALKQLADDIDEIERRMIYPAAGIVAEELNRRFEINIADQSYLGHKSGTDAPPHKNMNYDPTGTAKNKFGITGMKQGKTGDWNTRVGWDGYELNSSGGEDKARPIPLIINAMESGTSKMKARPIIKPTVEAVRKKAEKAMEDTMNSEIKKRMK